MKLSKREKILLMILGVTALCAAFVLLVINPLNKQITANRATLLSYQDMEMTTQIAVSGAESVREAYEKSAEEAKKASADFPGRQKSYDIHTEVTALCARYGVTVRDLLIADYLPVDTGSEEPQAALYVCRVTATLAAPYESLLELEDAFAKYAGNVCVSAFAVQDILSEGEQKDATLQLDFYAIEGVPEESLPEEG